MAAFRYEALDASGRPVSGVLQADTPRHARALLRAQGLLPSAVDAVGGRPAQRLWGPRISPAELCLLTQQLATLLESGLTMEQALSALIEQSPDQVTRETLAGVKAEVMAGLSLAAALGSYERSFPEFYRALVQGGEESGALPRVLQHLAGYLDARQALQQKITLALLYPALVTAVAVLIVGGLLAYVVPQVVQVFQQSKQTLPWLTRGLIALSNFLNVAWPWLLAGGAAIWLGGLQALRRESFRRRWHRILLGLPGLGALIRGVNTARFASTLAILVGGGVPLLTALQSASRVMSNLVLRGAVEHAIGRVREGASLARALEAEKEFPPLLTHLIASGEASGRLGTMLERAAGLETRTLERRLAVFLTVLEPAMILVMGGVVLLIVLAILLPVIEINQLVR